MVTKNAPTSAYGADQMLSFEPLDHIRKRPGIYLGEYSKMQGVALREPIDNSIDEFRAGYGKTIRVTVFEDGSASVEDEGRGVPVDVNTVTNENGIYMAFGKVGSGGKFGAADSVYANASALGLNGVGTTATNATSLRFDVIVYRDGKEYRLSFKGGVPGHFDKDNGPDDKFTPNNDIVSRKDPRTVAEKKVRATGTTIKFWPDPSVFGTQSVYHINGLRESLRSTAFLVPGIKIIVDDRLGEPARSEEYGEEGQEAVAPQYDEYEFDGGIAEMLDLIAPDTAINDTISLNTSGKFTERVPVPQKSGPPIEQDVERTVDVEVALRWGNGYDYTIRSFVNTIRTTKHGTHVRGLELAMNKLLIDSVKGVRGLIKPKEEPPKPEDVNTGLSAIISISQMEPSLVGQDKQQLGDVNTQKIVQQKVLESLADWMNNKKNATALKVIQNKIAESSRIRQASRKAKEVEKRKSALRSASMPSKLVDCSEIGTEHTELLITEGDSALGTLKMARDSRYQALLPIRGKILNAQKASALEILNNKETSEILQVIGAGSGRTFDLTQMRVARVIIAADADIDGAHIATLLVTMFAKLARPLVEAGRLFVAVPPLYAITTKGKNPQTFYFENDQKKDKKVAELEAKNIPYEKPISRLKGLGEMDAEEFWDTTLNPETRTLRRIDFNDVHAAELMIELAMGKKVEPRKEWIMESRALLSDEDLDF